MGRFRLALRVLFDSEFAKAVAQLASGAVVAPQGATTVGNAKSPSRASRSEALTLLQTLQREARFVDFLKEPLDGYADAQIGAAVREVHRDCNAVVERIFAIRPAIEASEGSRIDLPASVDAGRYRLTGNVTAQRPSHGQLVHHGWEATRCELPEWTGSDVTARVVAPAEVEVR